MRKTLLATSALIAAGALSGQAVAEMKLDISGGAQIEMDFISDDGDTGVAQNGDEHGIDFGNSSTQIFFTAENTADNGLTYGYKFDMRTSGGAGNTTISNDESYMYFSGNWGAVHLGNDDNVIDNNVPGGESVLVGAWGYDGSIGLRGTHIGGATGTGTALPTLAHSSGDTTKIAYYSPSFNGFDVAASYTPDPDSNNQLGNRDNQMEVAARYQGDFGDVNVGVGVGYLWADQDVGFKDSEGLMAGATVGFGAFSAAIGYGDNGDSGIATTSNADAGGWWNVGLAYAVSGSTSVSFGYMNGEEGQADGTEDEIDIFALDVQYTVAEGLTAFGELQYAESEDSSANQEYESEALILGTRISF